MANGGWCSCPDHEERGVKCKHIWAVELTVTRETNEKGEVTETRTVKATYSQEWSRYNAAQTTEKERFTKLLSALVALVPDPDAQTIGRPRLPMSDMVFATVYKAYSTVSGRRFMCNLRDAYERGYVSQVPHYNSLFNYMDTASMTPVLRDLVTESALPLREVESDFAVDSSGFSTSHRVTWYDKKYGDWHEKIRRLARKEPLAESAPDVWHENQRGDGGGDQRRHRQRLALLHAAGREHRPPFHDG